MEKGLVLLGGNEGRTVVEGKLRWFFCAVREMRKIADVRHILTVEFVIQYKHQLPASAIETPYSNPKNITLKAYVPSICMILSVVISKHHAMH